MCYICRHALRTDTQRATLGCHLLNQPRKTGFQLRTEVLFSSENKFMHVVNQFVTWHWFVTGPSKGRLRGFDMPVVFSQAWVVFGDRHLELEKDCENPRGE